MRGAHEGLALRVTIKHVIRAVMCVAYDGQALGGLLHTPKAQSRGMPD